MQKLDYTIQSPEERNELVKKILEENPEPNSKYLEILGDYLILCMEKQEKKEKKILTENRMTTVNKRETSFEGLISQLENGEDGIYNIVTNDKNIIFQSKVQVTKKDLEQIPFMRQLRETINFWEERIKQSEGKNSFLIKRMLIELRKDQYIIKNAYLKPIMSTHLTRGIFFKRYPEEIEVTEDGNVKYSGMTLLNPECVKVLLHYYSRLKADSWDSFQGDLWYLLVSLEDLIDRALISHPTYRLIIEKKIDGWTNLEIQAELDAQFGVEKKHSLEYISSLWCNKIPKMISNKAKEEWIIWHYTIEEEGKWKRCSKCGQIKLANNLFFSKNKTSKDGFYSICKVCRNTK